MHLKQQVQRIISSTCHSGTRGRPCFGTGCVASAQNRVLGCCRENMQLTREIKRNGTSGKCLQELLKCV